METETESDRERERKRVGATIVNEIKRISTGKECAFYLRIAD